MNRKDFLKQGRWAILSGIGLFIAFLAYKEKVVTPENCAVAQQCKNCGRFAQCELPKANKEKRYGI